MFGREQQQVSIVLHRFGVMTAAARIQPAGSLGGLSGCEFWRVDLSGEPLLLRRWPTAWDAAKVSHIHQVLSWAAERGIACLPLPRPNRQGGTLVQHEGRLWELTPWLPGESARDGNFSPAQLAAACQYLAKFHVAVATLPQKVPTRGRPPSIAKRVSRQREATSQAWLANLGWEDDTRVLTARQAKRLAEDVLRLLPSLEKELAAVASKHYPLQTIVGDARSEHFLFTGERVTGMVDFGAMTYDSPMADLARLLGDLSVHNAAAWRDGLAAYEGVAPVTDDERRLLPVLDRSGVVLSAYQWLAWLCRQRRQFGDPSVVRSRLEYLEGRLLSFS